MAKISPKKDISLEDRDYFDKFLGIRKHVLSPYHFANIFIWHKLFEIFWHSMDGNLCVFFKTAQGCFMYLPPLGGRLSVKLINECFSVMDGYNENKAISRIENVEKTQVPFFEKMGLRVLEKPGDYLYLRDKLTQLRGNDFKPKRASCNQFEKKYRFEYCGFSAKDKKECLLLCKRWIKKRKSNNTDYLYRAMLDDSFLCQEAAISRFLELGMIGRVIKIGKKITAYTFGYRLNKDTFCNLFEVCDDAYRGIYQFIFRRFCADLADYKYINTLDDSGLENLRRAKSSYRPVAIIKNYIITR